MTEGDAPAGNHLLGVSDLDRSTVDHIMSVAEERGDERRRREPFVAGLFFLTSSLRTHVGFAVAARRLGGDVADVTGLRFDEAMSDPESLEDSVRALATVCDVVVCRQSGHLVEVVEALPPGPPVINGGDAVAHPTQALIDLWTIQRLAGGIDGRRIGLCGDLTMRAARSLISILGLFDPAEVVLIAPEERMIDDESVPKKLRGRTARRSATRFDALDVVYLPGLPPGVGETGLTPERRLDYALTPLTIGTLPGAAVVLSPLPIIDEIDPLVMGDPRVRPWATHEHSTPIRMAVLEHVLRVP